MINLIPKLLPILEKNKQGLLPIGENKIFPHYGGFSICNLAPSICQWLGAPPLGSRPLSLEICGLLEEEYQHVILLVVDGLGLEFFQRFLVPQEWNGLKNAPILRGELDRAVLAPLTSLVPSTTAAGLTSFWTGLTSAEHGMVAYDAWLKEYGMVANLIYHGSTYYQNDPEGLKKAGFQPEHFLKAVTLGSHLARSGVNSYSLIKSGIARSSFSSMLQKDASVLPFSTLSDLWITLQDHLDSVSAQRTFHYVYWDDIDMLSHRFGPEDERVVLEFGSFSRLMYYFISGARRKGQKILFLLTADHGQIGIQNTPAFDLRRHPEFMNSLVMAPAGEARLPFLFIRSGCEELVRQYTAQTWGDTFHILTWEQIWKSGLMGESADPKYIRDRVGDCILVPEGNAYLLNKEFSLVGRHGGLSPQEMLVPLFALQI